MAAECARDRPADVGAAAAAITPPPGDGPVVLVAPSTAQDREQLLLRSALAALRHIEDG